MDKESLLLELIKAQKEIIELQKEVMRLSKPIVVPTSSDFIGLNVEINKELAPDEWYLQK